MGGILQDGGGTGYVMVVGKAEQVLALVQRPLLRAVLPLEGVDDLKQVHGVQRGVQPFIALVVGAGMEHLAVDPLVIVAVEGFAHQEELRLEAVAEGAQAAQKVLVQAVGHVQPQPVDAELVHPELHAVQQVVHHCRVAQVELHQFKVALPALVPEAVVVVGIAVEADVEPVLIGGVPLLFLYVPEGPEASAHMVEHPVQHHFDAMAVEGLADLGEVRVGAQSAVNFAIIPGVVAVAVALKDGGEVQRVHPQLLHMARPAGNPADAAGLYAVIIPGGSTEAQGIDLIKYALLRPHGRHFPSECTSWRPRP